MGDRDAPGHRPLILGACHERAATPREVALALSAPRKAVRYHVQRLLHRGILLSKAPSRYAGRLLTPYRSSGVAQARVTR